MSGHKELTCRYDHSEITRMGGGGGIGRNGVTAKHFSKISKYRSKITVAVAPACCAQRLPRPPPGASVRASRSDLTHARKNNPRRKKNLRAKPPAH